MEHRWIRSLKCAISKLEEQGGEDNYDLADDLYAVVKFLRKTPLPMPDPPRAPY